jgi:hypothetical protein
MNLFRGLRFKIGLHSPDFFGVRKNVAQNPLEMVDVLGKSLLSLTNFPPLEVMLALGYTLLALLFVL